MSDRTFAQVVIHSCPDGQVQALEAVLAELEYDCDVRSIDGRLALDVTYSQEEAPLDYHETTAAAIRAAAPGAAWRTWVDPKYEYDGILIMYTPELGVFEYACNAQGDAVFTATDILSVEARRASEATEESVETSHAFGVPWMLALGVLPADYFDEEEE